MSAGRPRRPHARRRLVSVVLIGGCAVSLGAPGLALARGLSVRGAAPAAKSAAARPRLAKQNHGHSSSDASLPVLLVLGLNGAATVIRFLTTPPNWIRARPKRPATDSGSG